MDPLLEMRLLYKTMRLIKRRFDILYTNLDQDNNNT